MGVFKQLARVKQARQRVARRHGEMIAPAAALLDRGRRHPLTVLGAAAGAGLLLGRLGVGPLRVPGLITTVSAGLAEVVAYGTRLVAGLSMAENPPVADSEEP